MKEKNWLRKIKCEITGVEYFMSKYANAKFMGQFPQNKICSLEYV